MKTHDTLEPPRPLLEFIPDPDVREIILLCTVKSPELFPDMVGKLIREIRALDPTARPGAYIDAIRVWYDLNIWQANLYIWGNVVEDIIQLWDAITDPKADNERLIRCVKREPCMTYNVNGRDACEKAIGFLSRFYGRREFFLSARMLAKCTDLGHVQAAKILNAMNADGTICFVKKGSPSAKGRIASVIDCKELFQKRTNHPGELFERPESRLISRKRPAKVEPPKVLQPGLDNPLRPWWLSDYEPWDGVNRYGPEPTE